MERKKWKQKKFLIPAIMLSVILIAFAGLKVYNWYLDAKNGEGAYQTDANAVDWNGELPGEEAEEGFISIPGYEEIPLAAGSSESQIALTNPESNTCLFQFELIEQDTGEVLYTSDMVEPGKAVVKQELSKSFEVGDYPLIIRINTFSEDGKESYNGSDVATTLHVFEAS